MTSKIAMKRIDQALEKLDTETNANFDWWAKEDALNKACNDWVRRQFHGTNQYKEGQEESTTRVDDLQVLLREVSLKFVNGNNYADTSKLPKNYRYYNLLTVFATKDDCNNIQIPSLFVENSNVNDYLSDWTISPDFDFEQCFHVLLDNHFRIFKSNYKIERVLLSYYKNPDYIDCSKKKMDKVWEWKDDVAEVIIDEAVKLLAGNIEYSSAFQLANNRVENNN